MPVKIDSDTIVIIFEVWSLNEYKHTSYVLIDNKGNPKGEIKKICYPIRAEDVRVDGDKINIFSYGSQKEMQVFELIIS